MVKNKTIQNIIKTNHINCKMHSRVIDYNKARASRINYITPLFQEHRSFFRYQLYTTFKKFIYVAIMCSYWALFFV